MNFAHRTLTGIAALGLLAGCGNMHSDATAKYKDVEKDLGPQHNTPFVMQTAMVDTPVKVNIQNAEFIVGQAGEQAFTVEPGKNVAYSLRLGKAPQGMKIESKGENQFALTWTPSEGNVPREQASAVLSAEIIVDLKASKGADLAADGAGLTKSVDVTVKRHAGQASISISGAETPATLSEGQSFEFTLQVSDPSTTLQPAVESAEVEAGSVNGSSMIVIDLTHMQKGANGVYTAHGVFTADLKKLNKQAQESIKQGNGTIPVKFGYVVTSALDGSEIKSPVKSVGITLNSEAPAISVVLQKRAVAARGKKNTITIIADVKNHLADTNIDKAALQAALTSGDSKLPGTVEITGCKDANETPVHTCTIAWTVDCEEEGLKSEYAINVQASSTLFGETKSSTKSQTLKLAPVCPAPAAKKVAAKPAAKKPAPKTATKVTKTSTAPTAGGKQ